MRSKVHSALTAPLVLHHTRIYKCSMKKFGFNCQMHCQILFFTGKRRYECCAMVLKKRLNFFYFQWPKVDQVRSEYLRSYLNWLHNCQLKNRRRSHTLKGSHTMGDGRIFLKTRRDVFFKKCLSNGPTFGLIHLAGQYLSNNIVDPNLYLYRYLLIKKVTVSENFSNFLKVKNGSSLRLKQLKSRSHGTERTRVCRKLYCKMFQIRICNHN